MGAHADGPDGRTTSALRVAAAVARDLTRLLVPVECAGCGLPDEPWCGDCRALLAGPAWRSEGGAGRLDRMDGTPPLPVWSLAPYVGPVRETVVAWKDRGRFDLTKPLAGALAAGVASALRSDVEPADAARVELLRPGPVVVLGAPSTAAARRRRGEDLVGQLARAVAGALSGGAPGAAAGATVVDGLVRVGSSADQVGLGARGRARNLIGHVRVRRRHRGLLAGARVVLVDDVLTSGATLAACRRAVEAVGALVVAGFTLAATPGAASRPVALEAWPSAG